MRWIFVTCILLTAAANVLSKPHQKRDLTYIKNLIGSKLFGTDTIVIQQPEIPKNKSYQIYKIPGHDNILLKVIRKKEAQKDVPQEEHKKEKYEDPVIVSPDIAIIGNYLGTSTEGETLLAIEIAKNLLKTGVLSGKRDQLIKEVVVPMTPKLPYNYHVAQEHVKQQNILTEATDPFYINTPIKDQAEQMQVVNRNQFPVFPEYPPIVLASEVKFYVNFTVVKFGNVSRLNKDSLAKTNILKLTDEVPKDYIFIPPENVDTPPPNVSPKTNKIQGNIIGKKDTSEYEFKNARGDQLDLKKEKAETLRGDQNSLNNHPVVVLDDKVFNQKQVKSVN